MKTEDKKETPKETKPPVKARVKKSILVTFIVALVFVIFSVAYFNFMLPVLNVLYNPAVDDPGQNENPEIDKDNLIDKDDPYYHMNPNTTPGAPEDETPTPVKTPTPTPDPDATPTPTPDPDASPTPYNGEEGFDIEEAVWVHASEMVFEEGTKNILLLGFNPKDRLCDSIFVLNINDVTKEMKIISIPRDTYVPHSMATKDALRARGLYDSPGMHKLNACVYIGRYVIKYVGGKFGNSGVDFLCAIISSLFPGCEIDDYVYVDFDGFMDIIDVVGGVYVTSPEDMYTEQGELAIKEGLNKLTAREALFYVRYRKRLDSSGHDTYTGSDNWRKINQANFIAEVSTQIVTKENMKMDKILDTMEVLKKSVFHSITPEKLNYYIGVGLDFADKQYKVHSYVIKGYTIDPFGDKAGYSQLD